MRTVGRLAVLVLVFSLSASLVFVAIGLEARWLPTIWLPVTLAAIVPSLLLVLPIEIRVRALIGGAISGGVLLMWLLSEPSVKAWGSSGLGLGAWFCALVCIGCEGALLSRTFRGVRADRQVFKWASLLVLMSWLVAYFSSPSGSAGGMLDAAQKILGLTPSQAETLIFFLRKSIHFTFYGSLGWTGFRLSLACGAKLRRSLVFGIAIALAFACFDEGRQTFFPDRTASILDVILDSSGALFFISMSGLARNFKR